MENRKGVILQGHLIWYLKKMKIRTMISKKIRSKLMSTENGYGQKGTTLGADNGMGVAAGMAMLTATDIPHGPLEVLITATGRNRYGRC